VEYFQGRASVRVLDNLRSGSRHNLAGFQCDFVEGSILDRPVVAAAMQEVDFVFHLAAMVSVPESVANPVGCEELNTAGTALVLEEAALCPSGRYSACDPITDQPYEPEFEPSIALVEDPSLGVSGPLWLRGGIPVFSAEYEPYEVRNRVTLCRCGRSANKPFCDGSHIAAEFKDGA